MKAEYHILNLGAGVQSTALALMSKEQVAPDQIPVFDCAIFADTQEEPTAVYEHLAWLERKLPFSVLRVTAGKLGNQTIHGIPPKYQEPSLAHSRFASIPAFTKNQASGEEGMVPRQCTSDYKIDPIEQAIRRQVLGLVPRARKPKGITVHQYVGLSYDEWQRYYGRAGKPGVKDRIADRGNVPHAPLIDLFLSRPMLIDWLSKRVGHEVPRSACVFCPYRSNAEWQWLKANDPIGWARAIEIDEAMRDMRSRCSKDLNSILFLHRTCVPLAQADLSVPDPKPETMALNFSALECEGMCGV